MELEYIGKDTLPLDCIWMEIKKTSKCLVPESLVRNTNLVERILGYVITKGSSGNSIVLGCKFDI